MTENDQPEVMPQESITPAGGVEGRPRRTARKPAGTTKTAKTSRRKAPAKQTAAAPARRPRTSRAAKGKSAETGKKANVASVAQETAPVPAPDLLLDHEEVARLAYSYWESRNFQNGSPDEDWYRAVEELRRRKAR